MKRIQLPHWFVKVFGGTYYGNDIGEVYWYYGEINIWILKCKLTIKNWFIFKCLDFAVWLERIAHKIVNHFDK